MIAERKHEGCPIAFMECISKPRHYVIIYGGKQYIETLYLKFNRLEGFHPSTLSEGQRKNGIDYGCPKVDVRPPVIIEAWDCMEAADFRSSLMEKFADFFVEETDIERNRGFNFKQVGGWYFIDKLEPEKWLSEYYELQNKSRQESLKTSVEGRQMSLF